MANPIIVTNDNFESEVIETETPVLVDFYADWCGPCKMMAPIVDELVDEFEGRVKIAKMNVDINQQTSARYSVRSIPTMIIFQGGKPIAQAVGARPKAVLKQGLEEIIAGSPTPTRMKAY